MEDDTREFLLRIVNSISVVLLWMIACVFFGIFLGYGFFEGSPGWQNIIFYFIFLTTLVILIRYIIRKWRI